MTNEQINIAIAERCGVIADYCNDFFVIQEAAENHLTLKEKGEFSHKLNLAVWPKNDKERNKFLTTLLWEQMFFYVLNANPRQRAEAFLKTIGKWEEQ